jgi:thiosulfate dehydrogenase [quinone] large subunit
MPYIACLRLPTDDGLVAVYYVHGVFSRWMSFTLTELDWLEKRRPLMSERVVTEKGEIVQDPPMLKALLNNPKAGWFWLIPRVWLGIVWFRHAQEKLVDPQWMQTGETLKGFWENAVKGFEGGRPNIAFDWYRSFIQWLLDTQSYTWFSKLVAYGELIVGILLIVGAFTGLAALAGGFMNWNYMMAGSASTNPMLFLAAVGLIMAWKVAGYIGADYFLLRYLGTPWHGKPANTASPSVRTTATR